MIEIEQPQMSVSFLEKRLTQSKPSRCVDGRPCLDSDLGPQMLGGSTHPITLRALYKREEINTGTITESINTLQAEGIETGAHRGEHKNDQTSDCGFADRLPEIITTAQEKEEEISNRLKAAFEANRDKFEPFNLPPFQSLLSDAYKTIKAYNPNDIKLKGESLVGTIESSGAKVENVEGNHAEEVAFVNINPNVTLNTLGMNNTGRQAFNLDLLPAVTQAKSLGVPETFSIPASLILYQATEMVLVEGKGKPAIPMQINS